MEMSSFSTSNFQENMLVSREVPFVVLIFTLRIMGSQVTGGLEIQKPPAKNTSKPLFLGRVTRDSWGNFKCLHLQVVTSQVLLYNVPVHSLNFCWYLLHQLNRTHSGSLTVDIQTTVYIYIYLYGVIIFGANKNQPRQLLASKSWISFLATKRSFWLLPRKQGMNICL